LNRGGRLFAGAVLVIVIGSWWGPGFAELDPGLGGVREQDQFRMVSRQTDGLVERYSPRARLLNLSDRMEQSMGRMALPSLHGEIAVPCANVVDHPTSLRDLVGQ